jgi:hypothetical protein
MKIVANIIGIVCVVIGALWFSQGMNWIRAGFMAGHRRWILIGGVVLAAGVVALIFGNRGKKGLPTA